MTASLERGDVISGVQGSVRLRSRAQKSVVLFFCSGSVL